MGTVRLLNDDERALLHALIAGKPQAAQFLGSLSNDLVEEMNDGGMGSLRFCARDSSPRALGEQLAAPAVAGTSEDRTFQVGVLRSFERSVYGQQDVAGIRIF